jgi:hypothetical protein
MKIELISDGPEVAAVVYLQSLQRQEHEVHLKSGKIIIIMANDHLIEFHLIEIVIFHLIESFN